MIFDKNKKLKKISILTMFIIVFAIMVAIVIVLFFSTYYSMSHIKASGSLINKQVLPLLLSSKESSTIMAEIIQDLEFLNPKDDINIQLQILQRVNRQNNILFELIADSSVHDDIQVQYSDVKNDVDALIKKHKTELLSLQSSISTFKKNIDKNVGFFEGFLQEINSLEADVMLASRNKQGNGTSLKIEQDSTVDALVEFRALSDLNHNVSKINEYFYRISNSIFENKYTNISSEAAILADNIIGNLNSIKLIDFSKQKTEISIKLLEVLGQGGVLEQKKNIEEIIYRIEENTALLKSEEYLLREILSSLIDDSKRISKEVNTQLDDKTDEIVNLNISVLLLLVSFLLIVFFVFVYRGLVKPLRLLSKETSSLAKGNLNIEIRDSLFYELNENSIALETFRKDRLALEKIRNDLDNKIAQLEIVNSDLERFAYVASHDLKSPLNSIQKLVKWIEEDCSEVLPASSSEHLRLLTNRTQRMSKLLDDLLMYSRIGRFDYTEECIQLNQTVEDIFDFLDIPESFECIVSEAELVLPRIPFEIVIRNLISNAVKHHDKAQGMIEIKYEKDSNTHVIQVKDDGPGIPMNLRGKAMEMFQTLRPRDQVEGSGMGLAIIKKIIEHYDGTINIEANDGRNTNIILRWPVESR